MFGTNLWNNQLYFLAYKCVINTSEMEINWAIEHPIVFLQETHTVLAKNILYVMTGTAPEIFILFEQLVSL